MRLHTYHHIIDDDGNPVSEWVTDEEYERRERRIQDIVDCLRRSVELINKHEQCQKPIK